MPTASNQSTKPVLGKNFPASLALFQTPGALFGCLIFFAILWLLDFPKPYVDDLSYIGASLNLAGGGDFSNPLLSRQFSEHFAFFYPPIHAFVLAGWLKVFGISPASLTGFQNVMYLLCSASAILILRRHQSPVWVQWLVPLAATDAFLTHGLRPEPMAAAFIVVGFAIIECGVRNRIWAFLAFLLMFLGGGAAPRMILYAAVLIIFSTWRMGAFTAKNNRRWIPLGSMSAAGALAWLIFSAMISFKFREFWQTFRLNAQRVDTDDLVTFILKHLSCKEEILWLWFAIAILFLLRKQPRDELTRLGICLLPIVPIEIVTRLTAHGASLWYTLLICLFLAASFSKHTSAFWKTTLPIGMLLALLIFNSELIINVIGRLTGRIQETTMQESESLSEQIQGHTVLVDCAAARYYFNYRIPKGCIDFYFCVPFPDGTPLQAPANPADIYLVGPDNLDFLRENAGLDCQPPAKWSPVGYSRLSFYQNPRQIFVVPPAICKNIKIKF